jgi:hypothetical protein
MTELAGVFRRPFAQQIAAFRYRLRDLVPTSRWDDLWQEQHDRAFMVAGATKADLLADLGLAVDKAIAGGTTLEEFRKDFRKIVSEHGWHGWTGEGTERGEAWRTRVIYQTNMRVSYMAGRHAQLVAGDFAYWIYFHGDSKHPRLDHLSWDKIALPPDHEFWARHYPPNGWGCICYVIGARSLDAVTRRGGDPNKALPSGWQKIEPKTGAPTGIGKGWAYAPGSTVVDTVNALAPKLDALPEQLSIDLIQSWVKSGAFMRWLEDPQVNWPLVSIPADQAERIGAQTRVAQISAETALKQLREHPELIARDYALVQETVSQATHRILDGARSLIFVREADELGGHVLVAKATRTGKGLFLTSFRRISREQAKRDRELRRLLNKGS